MPTLSQSDRDKLLDFCFQRDDRPGSKYPGMDYEDGIMAVLDLMEGNTTIDEIVDD